MYTHVVAARPDTLFFSPIQWQPLRSGVRIPNYLHWGGLNDRFAYGDHTSMLFGYMSQFEAMGSNLDYLQMSTSEAMLCKHLVKHQAHTPPR